MSTNVKNMTMGNPFKLIFSFAIPLMAGNIFQQLYTVIDTMVVGKFLGVGALAALGATDWLSWLMLGTIQGLTQGFAIRLAQEFGANDFEELKKTIGNSVVLVSISSVVLLLLGLWAAEPILLLLHTPADILDMSLLYIRIIFAGTPIVMTYNLLACTLRALGDGKTPLHAMIVASIVNIVLDVVFVFGFRWGIAGAAAATLIAQAISCMYCLYYMRNIEEIRLSPTDFCLKGKRIAKLLWLGFPMALQNATIAIGGMIVQSVVNGFGVIFIAGFTATNKLNGLLEIAATSYGYAIVTYVGQNLGAKKLKRINQGMKSAFGMAMITSVVIAIIMLVFGKAILSCFISGTPAQVEQTMEIAYFYLAVMSISLPILYLLYLFRSGLQGLGNTVLPMLSGVAEFIMRIVTALILPIHIGEIGVCFTETAAWIGADIVLVSSYFVVMRSLKKQIKEEQGMNK